MVVVMVVMVWVGAMVFVCVWGGEERLGACETISNVLSSANLTIDGTDE